MRGETLENKLLCKVLKLLNLGIDALGVWLAVVGVAESDMTLAYTEGRQCVLAGLMIGIS